MLLLHEAHLIIVSPHFGHLISVKSEVLIPHESQTGIIVEIKMR
jgi:hypothetical protein